MTKVAVYFTHSIDSESHPEVQTQAEARVAAQALTSNKVSGFDWSLDGENGEGWFLLFREAVVVEIEEQGNLPLHMYSEVCDAVPSILGGEWSSNRRLK